MPVKQLRTTSLSVMAGQINSIISTYPQIDISVTAIDLNNNQAYNYGANVPFVAASTAKLITATDFLHQVEAGQESLNENLGGQSAQSLLKAMIVQSDDNAWYTLNNELGYDNLGNYAQNQIGIKDWDESDDTLMSGDIALTLQELYEHKLLNTSHTALLLSYMKIANRAEYIPAAVPAGVKVYHKAGWLDDRIHDSAIVDNGIHPYVLVIFTNGHGVYDEPQRTQILQDITKATVAHFIGS
ncbi:MAG TPA: serine hydrolase [Candidatus Saccharimonadales bacterium]|nr:serine hydrolase [Candidatus Saccharimonadales bacterium]